MSVSSLVPHWRIAKPSCLESSIIPFTVPNENEWRMHAKVVSSRNSRPHLNPREGLPSLPPLPRFLLDPTRCLSARFHSPIPISLLTTLAFPIVYHLHETDMVNRPRTFAVKYLFILDDSAGRGRGGLGVARSFPRRFIIVLMRSIDLGRIIGQRVVVDLRGTVSLSGTVGLRDIVVERSAGGSGNVGQTGTVGLRRSASGGVIVGGGIAGAIGTRRRRGSVDQDLFVLF